VTTTLRQVLDIFENATGPLSLAQMAARMGIEPAMLEGMIGYWVRKGRLREVGGLPACTTCGIKGGCPYVIQMPRRYELVTGDELQAEAASPPCNCCT
jgi:hypothetical protein